MPTCRRRTASDTKQNNIIKRYTDDDTSYPPSIGRDIYVKSKQRASTHIASRHRQHHSKQRSEVEGREERCDRLETENSMRRTHEHTPISSEWLSPDNNIHKLSNGRHERRRRKEKYQERREPSGMRISQLMPEDETRDGDSNYNYISASERLRRESESTSFDVRVNETEDSWDLSTPISSVSHTRSPIYVGGGVRTQKYDGRGREGVGGGNSCNASRMTGHVSTRTGHTGVTQKMNNHKYSRKKIVLECLPEEEDEYPQRMKERQERHGFSSNARETKRSTPPLHQTTTPAQMHPSSETPRSHVAINDEGMNNIEDVSSITFSNKEGGGGNNESVVDYGIDPTRGSFDLIIVPTNTKEQQTEHKKKRGHHSRSGHHHKKKQLTAFEAMSVAASVTSGGGKGNYSQADSQVYPKMNNLTYWSSLSVKAAMTVMTKENSRRKSEAIAQVAANTILEAGKKYDQESNSSGGKSKRSQQFSLKDLATKVSVAILEAGGEHTVASAVAVTIMNETLPSDEMEVKPWKQAADIGSDGGEKVEQVQESSKPKKTHQEPSSPSDESVTSSTSKRRELELKEAEIKKRKQELEEAILLNQQDENEIHKRITEYNEAKKVVESKHMQQQSKHMQQQTNNAELQKHMALKTKEEQIRLKNQQLEAASRLNQQKEVEIKERMMALDAATAALLKRAENIQNEIDHRNNANARQYTNNTLGHIKQPPRFDERGYIPQTTNGEIIAESYDNEPMGNSRFVWEQQEQQRRQQQYQQQQRQQQQQYQAHMTSPRHITSPHQKDMGFLENISCKLYSMLDEACDASWAGDNITKEDTYAEPKTIKTPYPVERFGSLDSGESSMYPQQQPPSSGMVNDQQDLSKWFDPGNIAQLQAQGKDIGVNQALIQAMHYQKQKKPPTQDINLQMFNAQGSLAESELTTAKTSKNRTRKGLPKLMGSFRSPFSKKDGKKQASKSNRQQKQPQVASDMLQMTTHNNLRNNAPPNMGGNNTHRIAEKKNGNKTARYHQPQESYKKVYS